MYLREKRLFMNKNWIIVMVVFVVGIVLFSLVKQGA